MMFPRSKKIRAWMKNDGIWLFEAGGMTLTSLGCTWLFLTTSDQHVVWPFAMMAAGFVTVLYGALFWLKCVAGDQPDGH